MIKEYFLIAALALPVTSAETSLPESITLTKEQAEALAQTIIYQQRQIVELKQVIYQWQLREKDLRNRLCI